MNTELKQFLCTMNNVNILFRKNALKLEELKEDWQELFETTIQKTQPITALNQESKQEVIEKINHILGQVPTYYNNNATILYREIKKDYIHLIHDAIEKEEVGEESLSQLELKKQTLDFEFENYKKHKVNFQKTLKSLNTLRNILVENNVEA